MLGSRIRLRHAPLPSPHGRGLLRRARARRPRRASPATSPRSTASPTGALGAAAVRRVRTVRGLRDPLHQQRGVQGAVRPADHAAPGPAVQLPRRRGPRRRSSSTSSRTTAPHAAYNVVPDETHEPARAGRARARPSTGADVPIVGGAGRARGRSTAATTRGCAPRCPALRSRRSRTSVRVLRDVVRGAPRPDSTASCCSSTSRGRDDRRWP